MAANKVQKVFCRGAYLAENTSQAASVEFVPRWGQIMGAADCENLSENPKGVLGQREEPRCPQGTGVLQSVKKLPKSLRL